MSTPGARSAASTGRPKDIVPIDTVYLGGIVAKATTTSVSFNLSGVSGISAAIAAGKAVAVGSLEFKSSSSTPTVSGGGGAWAAVSSGVPGGFHEASCIRRLLTAGDIAGALSINQCQNGSLLRIGVWAMTNPALPQVRVNHFLGAGNGDDHSLAGFTKAAKCMGLVGLMNDYDPDTSITVPAGWADRGALDATAGAGVTRLADLLNPDAYNDGTAILFEGMTGSLDRGSHAYIAELLRA